MCYLKMLRQSFQQYYFILIVQWVFFFHWNSKTRTTVRVVGPEWIERGYPEFNPFSKRHSETPHPPQKEINAFNWVWTTVFRNMNSQRLFRIYFLEYIFKGLPNPYTLEYTCQRGKNSIDYKKSASFYPALSFVFLFFLNAKDTLRHGVSEHIV